MRNAGVSNQICAMVDFYVISALEFRQTGSHGLDRLGGVLLLISVDYVSMESSAEERVSLVASTSDRGRIKCSSNLLRSDAGVR